MGSFNRRIVVLHRPFAGGGEARAVLEDDFHHFRVTVRHEVEHVVHVDGEAVRTPYTLCQGALGRLPQLQGMRLGLVASAVARATDATLQCTHLLDLAGLAIAASAAGRARRQYDIVVPDREHGLGGSAGLGEVTQPQLLRDGQPLLSWLVQGATLTSPPHCAGVSLREGFARWALGSLTPDEAEAAIVLRRCTLISLGRHKKLDAQTHAVPTGHCYAQQPERATLALRIVGSTLDFTKRADSLCADDGAWLTAFG